MAKMPKFTMEEAHAKLLARLESKLEYFRGVLLTPAPDCEKGTLGYLTWETDRIRAENEATELLTTIKRFRDLIV